MVTILIDSRFVNAAVYIVFDVIVFAVLSLALISLQSWLIRRTLLRGKRVSLREFRFSPLAGGVIADGHRFSALLVALHFVLLAILFALALGINGRTDKAKRPTTRQYISTLDPLTAPEVSVFDDRVYPQILAACNQFEHERLTYYPVAFNQEDPPSMPVSARHLLRSLNGNIGTAVNSGSVECQQYEGAQAMLTVSRCGTDRHSCCNLSLAPEVGLELENEERGPSVWETNQVRQNQSSVIIRRNVKPVSLTTSSTKYDRLICLLLLSQTESSSAGRGRTNCMLGTWNVNGTRLTFRLGHVTFPDSLQEMIFDVEQAARVEFMAFSVETEIEWDAEAEIILVNGLHSIGGNMVPARLFLDTLASRSSVAVRVTDQAIFEKYDVNVTDVSTVTVVGYAILVGLALLFTMVKLVVRWKRSFDERGDPWIPDITTYDGLLTILKGDERRRGGKRMERPKVEFGITSIGSLYSLGPVDDGLRVVKLPQEALLRWHRSHEDVMEALKDDETLETLSTDSV